MSRLLSTLSLVVVLAGLGAYIYFVDNQRPAASNNDPAARQKVFAVEGDKVNELRLTTKGESTLLRKSDAGWKIVEPMQVDADPPEVIGIATALGSVDIVRVVDENAANLEQFGLANPSVTIAFKADGGAAGALKLGNKNATSSEIYALKDDSKRVFLVSAFQESSFSKTSFDLRDKKILKFDRDKTDSLVLAKGTASMELARNGSDWRVVTPGPSRSDYSAIEGFVGRLASANMSKLVEENPQDLAKYGLDKPRMTVTLGAGSAKSVLEVGKTDNGDMFARDAARPLVFTLDSTLATDLDKPFDDYRKKELFEFRPFTLARLRAVLDAPAGPKTYEFEKQPPATPTDPETWKVTRAGGLSHTADQAVIDDLLGKLTGIRAESFVGAGTRTGIDKPALVVSASYEEGKFERVRIGAVGDNAYGRRDGEEGVAKIDVASLKAAMLAFDVAVTPKEAAPKAEEKK